ncbi:MAG: hypothetical protein EBZ53_07345 [Verrucomicrobia bacterium]|nr:hypothetical protein [Verrucomicrobiota bacterium]
MKNVTITLDEKVAHWARIWAARHDTSVSRILGEALREKMEKERKYGQAQRKFLQTAPRPLKGPGTAYPKREELYGR